MALVDDDRVRLQANIQADYVDFFNDGVRVKLYWIWNMETKVQKAFIDDLMLYTCRTGRRFTYIRLKR